MLVCSQTACGYFCSTATELSTCGRDCMASKAPVTLWTLQKKLAHLCSEKSYGCQKNIYTLKRMLPLLRIQMTRIEIVSNSTASQATEPSQLDVRDSIFSSNLMAQKPKNFQRENGKLKQMSDSNTKAALFSLSALSSCRQWAYLSNDVGLRPSIAELLR